MEYYYEIDTFCPASRLQATITLVNDKAIWGEVVAGKPVKCSLADTCQHKQSPHCYLKSLRLKARGRLLKATPSLNSGGKDKGKTSLTQYPSAPPCFLPLSPQTEED